MEILPVCWGWRNVANLHSVFGSIRAQILVSHGFQVRPEESFNGHMKPYSEFSNRPKIASVKNIVPVMRPSEVDRKFSASEAPDFFNRFFHEILASEGFAAAANCNNQPRNSESYQSMKYRLVIEKLENPPINWSDF